MTADDSDVILGSFFPARHKENLLCVSMASLAFFYSATQKKAVPAPPSSASSYFNLMEVSEHGYY